MAGKSTTSFMLISVQPGSTIINTPYQIEINPHFQTQWQSAEQPTGVCNNCQFYDFCDNNPHNPLIKVAVKCIREITGIGSHVKDRLGSIDIIGQLLCAKNVSTTSLTPSILTQQPTRTMTTDDPRANDWQFRRRDTGDPDEEI